MTRRQREGKSVRSRGRRFLLNLASSAFGLLIFVLADMVLSLVFPRQTKPQLLYRDPVDSDAYYLERGNLRPHRALSKEKPVGKYRIFAYGGSSTWGLPFGPHGSFTGWLKMLLDDDLGPGKVEIANLGYPAYSMQEVADMIEDSIPYHPDCIIVYSGHNEYLLHNLTLREIAYHHPAVWKVRHWAERHSAVYRLLRDLYQKHFQKKDFYYEAEIDHERYQQMVLPNFERNLERIIRLCRSHGIRLILATVIANDRDWQPVTAEPIPGERQARLAAFRKTLEEALPQEWERLIDNEVSKMDSDLRYLFHLAHVLLDLGETGRAAKLIKNVKDRDTWPVRVTTSLNNAIRRVAAANPEVLFFDAERYFEALASDGLIGYEFVLDSCHPTPESHFRIAREFYRLLQEADAIPGLGKVPPEQDFAFYMSRNSGFNFRQYSETAGYFYSIRLHHMAARYYGMILERFPEDTRALAWLALIAQKTGDKGRARQHILKAYEAALQTASDGEAARRSLLDDVFGQNYKAEREEVRKLLDLAIDRVAPQRQDPHERYSGQRVVCVWECRRLDGVDEILLSGTRAEVRHLEFLPPQEIEYHFFEPVSNPGDFVYEVVKERGRGEATIVEQPTPENGGVLVVRIDDGPFNGDDHYRLVVLRVP